MESARGPFRYIQNVLNRERNAIGGRAMSCKRTARVCAVMISAACVWPLVDRRLGASGQQPIQIHVIDYPRSVAAAVLQIEERFGWVVTYEDVRYVHPSDIVDVTEQVRRDGKMTDRVLGMRSAGDDTVDASLADHGDDRLDGSLAGQQSTHANQHPR